MWAWGQLCPFKLFKLKIKYLLLHTICVEHFLFSFSNFLKLVIPQFKKIYIYIIYHADHVSIKAQL